MAGGCAWQGACMVGGGVGGGMCGRGGGMHGRGGGHVWQGTCMVEGVWGRGHVWWGACMTGGMCGGGRACMAGRGACMHAMPDTTRNGDMVNEWVVRILLECILVQNLFPLNSCCHGPTLLSHRLAPVPADSDRSPNVIHRLLSASYNILKGPHIGIIYSEL